MKVPRLSRFAASCALFILPCASQATVQLPSVFGDHMVLQRGIPLPVWGTAEPGATVKISFSGQTASAVADGHGKWEVKLSPLTASETPSEMTIEEENKIVFFKVSQKIAFAPESDCEGKWTACTPETAPSFSAVGYFFGKEIQETQSIPVGLIGTHVGGTPAQAWTSLPALEANPKLAAYATGFRETKSNLSKLVENYQTTDLAGWEAETEAWNKIAAAAKAEGKEPNPPAQCLNRWRSTGVRPASPSPTPTGSKSEARRPSY